MSEQDNATDFIQSSNKAREYENKKKNKNTKMIKVIKKENREGMINIIANDLYRFDDIQEACIKLGFDNHKMLDELTGFPNGKDKCVGVLIDSEVSK